MIIDLETERARKAGRTLLSIDMRERDLIAALPHLVAMLDDDDRLDHASALEALKITRHHVDRVAVDLRHC